MLNQNQTNGDSIDEAFMPFIKRVLDAEYFGVSRGTMQLNSVTCSGKDKADRFNLSVPYAGQNLEWTVMFNSSCPEMGPDFEFHNDSFLPDPSVDMIEKYIPSLANWRPLNHNCLLNVLRELTQCYKLYQLELFNRQDQRLKVEYDMIIQDTEICSDDIEIILYPNDVSPVEAKFFIRLDMDFSRLPGRSNKPQDDEAMLIISFQQPNCSRITPQLNVTNQLEEIFGGPRMLHIPPYPRDKSVMEYIVEVKRVIAAKINTVANCFEERQKFIASMIFLQRRNVVEYDAEDFSRISILLEQQDFYFIVHFRIPRWFPKELPIVTLQSIYHMTSKDELYEMKIHHYLYSPRWPAPVMISKILQQIIQVDLPTFKTYSAIMNRR